jgi:HK97 gp10 family phage protein
MKVNIDTSGFKAAMAEKKAKIQGATRAMTQAGAEVIYNGARINVPVSDHPHMFHGTNAIYGPYAPGSLRDAIYQVYSTDNSSASKATYHVAWNHKKAPYGFMVEFGTSKTAPHSFLGKARVELSAAASDAMEMEFERRMAAP